MSNMHSTKTKARTIKKPVLIVVDKKPKKKARK